MAIPSDRNTFKDLVLQNLGKGILRVEVTDDEVDNWVDFALKKFQDYHFDGSQEMFYKYQITQTDVTNRWIPLPNDTIGAIEIFDLTSTLLGIGMWNVQYQFILSNLPNWVYLDLTQYWMTFSHLQLLQQILVGKQPLRYNRYVNQLYIDMDWSRVNVGDFLIVRIYQTLDPNTYTKIWSDQWLQEYTTQLVKRQWGNNLKKQTMRMPDGNTFNGQQIYDEAEEKIKEMEEKLINAYSLPPPMMIG